MSNRRRHGTRCRVEELEGRAVPSVTIVKAALDVSSDTLHVIGYIEKTPVAGLKLIVSVELETVKTTEDFVIRPPHTHITRLHTSPPPALPPGVKAHEITGIFDTEHKLEHRYDPSKIDEVQLVVKVELVHENGDVVNSATKVEFPLEVLTGAPPYLA
jgi:hypothetical protein